MKHGKNCKCSICASKEPELLGTWYETEHCHMEIDNIEKDNWDWVVNFVMTRKKGSKGKPFCKTVRYTVEQWNTSIKSWRRDLYPAGIPGKGWNVK